MHDLRTCMHSAQNPWIVTQSTDPCLEEYNLRIAQIHTLHPTYTNIRIYIRTFVIQCIIYVHVSMCRMTCDTPVQLPLLLVAVRVVTKPSAFKTTSRLNRNLNINKYKEQQCLL